MAKAAGRVSDNSADLIQQAVLSAGASVVCAGLHQLNVNQRNAYRWVGDPRFGAPDPQADARAESLLRSWLTPEQQENWVATRNFTVRGGSTGRRYRVGDGCYELGDDGQHVAYLCFGPVDWTLPSADRVLAKKLALECDEEMVLRVAGRTPAIHGVFTFGLELAQQQAQALALQIARTEVALPIRGRPQVTTDQQLALANMPYSGIDPQALANTMYPRTAAAAAAYQAELAVFDAMQARASAERQRRERLLDIAYGALILVGLFAFFASIVLS